MAFLLGTVPCASTAVEAADHVGACLAEHACASAPRIRGRMLAAHAPVDHGDQQQCKNDLDNPPGNFHDGSDAIVLTAAQEGYRHEQWIAD